MALCVFHGPDAHDTYSGVIRWVIKSLAALSGVIAGVALLLGIVATARRLGGANNLIVPFHLHQHRWEIVLDSGSGLGTDASITVSNETAWMQASNIHGQQMRQLADAIEAAHDQWRKNSEYARATSQPVPPEPMPDLPWQTTTTPGPVTYRCLLISIFGCAMIFPVIWYSMLLAREKRARIRKAKGLCVQCGYNLAATPERCPECGQFARIER
jgi:hypothetical protein